MQIVQSHVLLLVMIASSYEPCLRTLPFFFLMQNACYCHFKLLSEDILFLVVDYDICGEHVKVGGWCNSRTCWEHDACGTDGQAGRLGCK